jgi:hypothetical protein
MNDLSTPLTVQQSALPDGWVDRLFARFATLYGKHWLDLWADVPIDAVKATWSEQLTGCDGEQIRKALEHCSHNNKFPPTCPEFVALCRDFRGGPALLGLPAPRGGEIDPRVLAEIRKLTSAKKPDPVDWARRILKEVSEGTYRYPLGIKMAQEALGLVKH